MSLATAWGWSSVPHASFMLWEVEHHVLSHVVGVLVDADDLFRTTTEGHESPLLAGVVLVVGKTERKLLFRQCNSFYQRRR